jgi:hypothetical protein
VLDDIRERLLQEAVDRRRQGRVESVCLIDDDFACDLEPLRSPTLDQGVYRRQQSEVVEERRTQIVDDRAQIVGLELNVFDRLPDSRLPRDRLVAPLRRGEQHAQSTQGLERLVVKLARPTTPLGVGRGDCASEPVRLHAAVHSHRVGGRGGERPQQLFVLGTECSALPAMIERGQDPHAGTAVQHGNKQRRVGIGHAEAVGPDP